MSSGSQNKLHKLALILATILIAVLSARPYAGGWNDGSRLAAVESLADYHTWSIDESVFVRTPGIETTNWKYAYPPDDPVLAQQGTLDKLFINDHYYSDKSPVPSLLMAGVYKVLQTATGLTASSNPPLFCYLMALIFSGGAYVVSVCCLDATVALLDLPWRPRLLLVWSFALATIALPYARQVNNHIMLLAVFSAVIFYAVFITQSDEARTWRLVMIGSLAGIGYTIDLGTGPILVLGVIAFVAARTRSLNDVSLVLIMAFPWFLLHHVLNYRIGGVFMPANTVAKYFQWPGSNWTPQNLTGGWAHPNVWHFLVYTVALLFGKKGFVCHNLPLYLSIPAIVFLLRNKTGYRPLIWFSIGVISGTWLLYAVTSNNYSGACCSIRWFVPLLAPFYFLLAVFLKEQPRFAANLLILAAWGAVMGAVMWSKGPWTMHMVPGFWFFQAGALLSWLGWRLRNRKAESETRLMENPADGNHK